MRPFSNFIFASDSTKLIVILAILFDSSVFTTYVESTIFSKSEILDSYPFISTLIGSCPNTIHATNPPRIANIK
jgi:hypothetical protein